MTAKPKPSLRESLTMSLHPDIETKKTGEKHLEELSTSAGFLDTLLHLSSTDHEPSVRLVSSIVFRRYLEKFWENNGFPKKEIIFHFPSFLQTSKPESENQLFAALDYILKKEDVSLWSNIIAEYERLVNANEERNIALGLKLGNTVILSLIDGYKSETEFEKILDNTGDRILKIAQKCISDQKFELAALAVKVLAHSCESYIVPQFFKNTQNAQNVVSLCLMVSSFRIENVSLMKWSFVLINNMMKKTKKKKSIESLSFLSEEKALSHLYKNASEVIALCRRGLLSQKIETNALVLLKYIVAKDRGWAIVKKDVPQIISAFIIPAVSFSDELADVWEDSQIEFMRYQEAKYTHTPDTVANELFFEVVKRSKEDKNAVEAFVAVLFREISVFKTRPSEDTARIRYGGLALLQSCAKYLKDNKHVFDVVLEDLSSSYPIVRYMAFSALQSFGYYNQLPTSVLGPFLSAIESQDLAVVVESVLSLPHILENPEMKGAIKRSVPGFIKLILELSNRVQIEALSTTLEDVISLCEEEALSIAPGIAEAISASILQLLKLENQEQQEERYDVIDGYIRTIVSLIESLEKNPDALKAISQLTKPMIITVIREHVEHLPDMFPILVASSYALKNVDTMYDILEELLQVPTDELVIYAYELSGVLDNYITYGKAGIIKYLGRILALLREMIGDYSSDYDFPYICRVLESIILNVSSMLGNRIEELVRTTVQMVFGNKEALSSPVSLVAALEVVLAGFIFAPFETLKVMDELVLLGYFTASLVQNHKRFERVHDLKLLLLFSGTFLSLRAGALPSGIDSGMLVSLLHYSIISMPEALSLRESLKNGDEEYQDDDEYYYEKEYLEEDPTFETPLDAIDPYDYTRELFNGRGTVLCTIWGDVSEKTKKQIADVIQNA